MNNLVWLGHATFRVDKDIIVYFDPFQIDEGKKADLILVSHKHSDHCSKQDILKILKKDTVIVTEKDSAEILGMDNVIVLEPNQSVEVKGVKIKAVRAYNVDKPFHPKENDWLGYVVDFGDLTIYHAGDTDIIEEMKDIQCDIALVPLFPGDKYVMNPVDSGKSTFYFKSKYVVPMHYGTIGGDESDAQIMKENANPKSVVKVLKQVKNTF